MTQDGVGWSPLN